MFLMYSYPHIRQKEVECSYHFNSPTSAKVSISFAYELGSVISYDFSRDPKPGQDVVFDE